MGFWKILAIFGLQEISNCCSLMRGKSKAGSFAVASARELCALLHHIGLSCRRDVSTA